MYKRTRDPLYVNMEDGRTRLHDAPLLNDPFPNNEAYKKSIIHRGSTAWNSLSVEERNTPTFDTFKSMLKGKLHGTFI